MRNASSGTCRGLCQQSRSQRGLTPVRPFAARQPTPNAEVERFGKTHRTQVLSCHVFASLQEVWEMTVDSLQRFNHHRPREFLVLPSRVHRNPWCVEDWHVCTVMGRRRLMVRHHRDSSGLRPCGQRYQWAWHGPC